MTKIASEFYSTFLFADPSLLRGAGSVIDLGGALGRRYNHSATGDAADLRALRADTDAVLGDAAEALEELVAELR